MELGCFLDHLGGGCLYGAGSLDRATYRSGEDIIIEFAFAFAEPFLILPGVELSQLVSRNSEGSSTCNRARLAFHALLADVERETPAPNGTEYPLQTNLVLRESTALAPDHSRSR